MKTVIKKRGIQRAGKAVSLKISANIKLSSIFLLRGGLCVTKLRGEYH